MKLSRYDSDAYQILDEAGTVIYFALRLTNGRWGAYDRAEARLTKQTFNKPKDVLAYVSGRNALDKERGDG